jgi:hypothetical protein
MFIGTFCGQPVYGQRMAASLSNSAWVEWMTTLMGGGSRQTYAATLPPNRFYCLLDELPLHLIPRRPRTSLPIRNRPQLFVNPECRICRTRELPRELAKRREDLAAFALEGTIAWVPNGAENLLPFWLGPKLEAIVQSLKRDESDPAALADDALALLIRARILLMEGDEEANAFVGREEVKKAAASFQEKGYAPIADLIHPFHVAALRRYYRCLIRTGQIHLGDQQSPRRYAVHNDPVARFFHQLIAPKLSEIAGVPLKPSYVYMASYLGGAELKKHTDREQCEYSITLLLDFSPEPELESPWPIRLQTSTGTVALYQAIGDGLAYRGTQLPHYRDTLGEGQTSTSIFFHYVSADFAGSLD